MKDKRSVADVSRELIIDSIVLTQEVMHAIQNNLPLPIEHVILQRADATLELEELNETRPNLRLLSLVVLLAGVCLTLVYL